MKLIIVSGQEATGKTTVGKEIAQRLGYRYQSKDTIKEALFDTSQRTSWDYKWYESKAKKMFFNQIKLLIQDGENAVIESNFIGTDKDRLQSCLSNSVVLSEIYCTTKGMTSFKRFVTRNENGTRHKGHHDRRWYPKIFIENVLQYFNIHWPSKPSGLTKKLFIVDTTRFAEVNYSNIMLFLGPTQKK